MRFLGSHFNKAFKVVIEHEGGFVDDPTDRGKATNWGISQRAYPEVDVRNLTLKQAKIIYRDDYYDKFYDKLSEEIAIELFDTGVNMGVRVAKEFLQKAMNLMNRNEKNFADLEVDGILGKRTLAAYNKVNKKALLKVLNGLQFSYYVSIVENDKTQERYFNGWITRS